MGRGRAVMTWQVDSARGAIRSTRPPWRLRRSGLVLGALLTSLAITAACSKGSTGTTGTTTSPTVTSPQAGTTPPTTSPSASGTSPSSSPTAAGDLTGTWSGQYSGAYQGTFTLTWTQSGSKLSGSIDLASLGGTLPINGIADGTKIRFGTVGSTDITYSGSVSGDSMSGTYKVHRPGGASSGGPWSATKSS
jgi:hypothetical protein